MSSPVSTCAGASCAGQVSRLPVCLPPVNSVTSIRAASVFALLLPMLLRSDGISAYLFFGKFTDAAPFSPVPCPSGRWWAENALALFRKVKRNFLHFHRAGGWKKHQEAISAARFLVVPRRRFVPLPTVHHRPDDALLFRLPRCVSAEPVSVRVLRQAVGTQGIEDSSDPSASVFIAWLSRVSPACRENHVGLTTSAAIILFRIIENSPALLLIFPDRRSSLSLRKMVARESSK